MRSKDFAKAAGLAVVFDLTAHTFYRVSRSHRYSATLQDVYGTKKWINPSINHDSKVNPKLFDKSK